MLKWIIINIVAMFLIGISWAIMAKLFPGHVYIDYALYFFCGWVTAHCQIKITTTAGGEGGE